MNSIIIIIILFLLFFYFSYGETFNNVVTEGNIYIFYHVFCNKYTLEVVKDQINKIIFSGLYNKCKKIYCFMTGEDRHVKECIDYIKRCGNKFSVEDIGIDDKTYERFTLLKIKKYINPNDKFLYLHSKGITKQNNQYVTDWRNVMEYFLIFKFKDCLKELDNYDTVGINHINPIHYSGNFWWTKGSYYMTLADNIPDYYIAPENHICTGKPKARNMFSTKLEGIGHYTNLYPIINYVDL